MGTFSPRAPAAPFPVQIAQFVKAIPENPLNTVEL